MNNFANLADRLGELEAQKKALEEQIKAIKAEIKDTGARSVQGKFFKVTVGIAIRQNLDTAAVKAEMGQKWWDDHSNLSEVTTILVKSQVGA